MDGEAVDVGLVGDVVDVNPEAVLDIVARRPDPGGVHGRAGRGRLAHNVNADTAAARWRSRSAPRSSSCSPTWRGSTPTGRTAELLPRRSTRDELATLLPSLSSGMIPKMEACLRAVRGGVPRAHVIDGRVAALGAARGVHQRRGRDDGRPDDGEH